MKLDSGFKIKSSNPTSEMPKISFSCGLDIVERSRLLSNGRLLLRFMVEYE